MEAERRPLEVLKNRKQNEEDRLKLANDLTQRLNTVYSEFAALGRFKKFRELGFNIGRPDLVDVKLNNEEAEPGEYQLEVIQLAGRSSMLSNGFEDPNETQIGVGYFSYDMPDGETREVYVGDEDNTLYGIAKKINTEPGLNLQAMVVDDGIGSDAPWRLLVTHKKSGEVNDAEFPTFYFIDGDEDFYMDKERPAQNSVVRVNGFELEFEGTKVTSLLPGVTLDLKDYAPGKEFNFKIFADNAKIAGKVKAAVEKLNEVLKFIQQQNTLDESSNTSNTLGGDVTIQNIEGMIRRWVVTPIDTEFGSLRFADMGVTFQRNGLLEVNSDRLMKALDENFDAIAQYFTGYVSQEDGFADRIAYSLKSFTQQGGVMSSRSEGLKARIKDIDRQIENTEKSLEEKRTMLKNKFAQLDSAIAKMKGQQQYVQTLGGGSGGLTANLGAC